MSETKVAQHTPGPWEEVGLVIYGPDNIRIADVESRRGDATYDEAEANARLIADAPELLDALKGVLRDAEGYLRTHLAGTEANTAIMRRLNAARAAIRAVEKPT
jgi:hypothetical protein